MPVVTLSATQFHLERVDAYGPGAAEIYRKRIGAVYFAVQVQTAVVHSGNGGFIGSRFFCAGSKKYQYS